MQLFKSEMIFLHPPRTRPVYSARGRPSLRYGTRAPARSDACRLKQDGSRRRSRLC
jgi:hypothetical protein